VIDQNLLVVGQLYDKEFKVIFESNHSFIKDVNDKVILSIKREAKVSHLIQKEKQATYQVTINNKEIWLKRLGHFHDAIVLNLQRNELFHDYLT
jgi:hypothetical protein